MQFCRHRTQAAPKCEKSAASARHRRCRRRYSYSYSLEAGGASRSSTRWGAKLAHPFSHIVVVGVCLTGDTIYPAVPSAREVRLSFVRAYTTDEFEQSLRLLETGILDPRHFITSTVEIDGVERAFQALADPNREVKVLVTPEGR